MWFNTISLAALIGLHQITAFYTSDFYIDAADALPACETTVVLYIKICLQYHT